MTDAVVPVPPSSDRRAAWLALSHCQGAGPVLLKRAVEMLGGPEKVLGASAGELARVDGIGSVRAQSILRTSAGFDGAALLEQCAARAVRVLCPDDPDWPPGLLPIPDPPVVLYLRGRMIRNDVLAVGIVGSRRCTLYGREQAEKFAAGLAQAGVSVVSGGARGIDTAAHVGAMRAGGRTVVVQGCGLEHCYPPENVDLYDRIVREDRGAVISEFPLDQPPLAENFPPRNRIIAALALGVLVVEANLRSGSLITARLAADDYGREVFALPGRVDSVASSGTHYLIKSGAAALVENVQDILQALGQGDLAATGPAEPRAESAPIPSPRDAVAGRPPQAGESAAPLRARRSGEDANLTAPQRKIFEALRSGPSGVDSLCEICSLPASVVVAELTFLQIRGLVRRGADQTYQPARNGKS